MSVEASEAAEDMLWIVLYLAVLIAAVLVSFPTPSPVPTGVVP